METRKRSIAKALIYRTASILTIMSATWYFTGDLYQVTQIAVVYNVIIWTFYYFHERAWTRVTWGLKNKAS